MDTLIHLHSKTKDFQLEKDSMPNRKKKEKEEEKKSRKKIRKSKNPKKIQKKR